MNINFKITPSQKETIESRMSENGFDDISTYVNVVALKIQEFNLTATGETRDEASIKI